MKTNGDYKPSEHLVGSVPPAFEGKGRLALMAGAAVVLMIVAMNVLFPEPAQAERARVAVEK
jgi:hypothetical protein